MFLLLCPSLSHASYYGIGCISVYLYEVFTTKVKQLPELVILERHRAV